MKEVKFKSINSMTDADIDEALESEFEHHDAWVNLVFASLVEKFNIMTPKNENSDKVTDKSVQMLLQAAVNHFEEYGSGIYGAKMTFNNGTVYIAITRSGHVSPFLRNERAVEVWAKSCNFIIRDIGHRAMKGEVVPQHSVTIN